MTIKHREPFLNHIANSLGRNRMTNVQKPTWTYEPQKQLYENASTEDLITMLEKQCQTIHTTFKRTTEEQLHKTLQDVLQKINAYSIVLPDDERTNKLGLNNFFTQRKEDYDIRTWGKTTKEKEIAFAKRADVGLAYSDITLAESGTVTLLHNSNHGRALTLLPKTFIAIIEKETIVPRLTEAMQYIRQQIQNDSIIPSCISFISGSSYSADIELNLIICIHCIVKLNYIVIDS